MIEGNNLIEEALGCSMDIEAIFVREDYEGIDSKIKEYESFISEVYALGKSLFDSIAQTETSQGIIAIVKKKDYTQDDFTRCCKSGNILVLDRLQDLGNIGTMIRTAEAAGYKGIVVIKGTGDVFSPKVVRAAAGSIFRMSILFADDAEYAITVIRAMGKKIISTCFETEINYFDVDLQNEVALLIGNEGGGLSPELIDKSDVKVKIPMEVSVNSLNAAVAAGILMYESIREKKKG